MTMSVSMHPSTDSNDTKVDMHRLSSALVGETIVANFEQHDGSMISLFLAPHQVEELETLLYAFMDEYKRALDENKPINVPAVKGVLSSREHAYVNSIDR